MINTIQNSSPAKYTPLQGCDLAALEGWRQTAAKVVSFIVTYLPFLTPIFQGFISIWQKRSALRAHSEQMSPSKKESDVLPPLHRKIKNLSIKDLNELDSYFRNPREVQPNLNLTDLLEKTAQYYHLLLDTCNNPQEKRILQDFYQRCPTLPFRLLRELSRHPTTLNDPEIKKIMNSSIIEKEKGKDIETFTYEDKTFNAYKPYIADYRRNLLMDSWIFQNGQLTKIGQPCGEKNADSHLHSGEFKTLKTYQNHLKRLSSLNHLDENAPLPLSLQIALSQTFMAKPLKVLTSLANYSFLKNQIVPRQVEGEELKRTLLFVDLGPNKILCINRSNIGFAHQQNPANFLFKVDYTACWTLEKSEDGTWRDTHYSQQIDQVHFEKLFLEIKKT